MAKKSIGERRAAAKVTHPTREPILRVSLGDEIYDTLLSQLITLKIAPGSRIAVDALVRELGVSQTPIRAALIRLETDGLVVKLHNIGYSAAPNPTRERIEQIYEMRLLLEPFMAAKTAARMNDGLSHELAAMEKKMATPASKDAKLAYGKFALLDADFHTWIATHSGNAFAAEALGRLYVHTQLYRLRFHSRVMDEAIEEHARIVKALQAGDAARAKTEMERHLQRSRARLAPAFEALP